MSTSHATRNTIAVATVLAAALAATPRSAPAQDRVYAVKPVTVAGDLAGGTARTIRSIGGLGLKGSLAAGGSLGISDSGVWIGQPGKSTLARRLDAEISPFEPAALSGRAMAGTDGLAVRYLSDIVWDASGTTLSFVGAFGHGTGTRQGVWTGAHDKLALVARTGDRAPGTAGRAFARFQPAGAKPFPGGAYGPVPSRAGDIAFHAIVDAGGRPAEAGIWASSGGNLAMVALTGEVAPGAEGRSFAWFDYLSLNAWGQVAFLAGLDQADAGNQGIWAGFPGLLLPVARSGEVAPGTGGQTFKSFKFGPLFNNSGEVAFFASLNGSHSGGLWAGTPGKLALIVRAGDLIEVGPGNFRTVESVSMLEGGGNEQAGRSRMNDAGQIMFAARFVDGSNGVFQAAPLPAALSAKTIAEATGAARKFRPRQTLALVGAGSTGPRHLRPIVPRR